MSRPGSLALAALWGALQQTTKPNPLKTWGPIAIGWHADAAHIADDNRQMGKKKAETLRRLLDVSAEMFLADGFENVSIAAIAKASHCSTATVYDSYRSKEQLFAEAMSKALTPTPIHWDRKNSGFSALLAYTRQRVVTLSADDVRSRLRAVIMQPELTRASFSAAERHNRAQNESALLQLVTAAQEEGMLRRLDQQVVLDHFKAMTNECILLGLLHGVEHLGPPEPVLRSLFVPLVTEAGHSMLQQYLGMLGVDVEPTAADPR